jgi:hypothetical protein
MWFNVAIRVEGAESSNASEEEVFAALKDEVFKLEIDLNDGRLVGITHFQRRD